MFFQDFEFWIPSLRLPGGFGGKITLGSLPETNSNFAPENGWLEDFLVSFWGPAYSQV